jgi:hypothetical protein
MFSYIFPKYNKISLVKFFMNLLRIVEVGKLWTSKLAYPTFVNSTVHYVLIIKDLMDGGMKTF